MANVTSYISWQICQKLKMSQCMTKWEGDQNFFYGGSFVCSFYIQKDFLEKLDREISQVSPLDGNIDTLNVQP